MRGSPYRVIVCDLFHSHAPDHETVVRGFPTRELAVEYARRRTWSSVEEMRKPGLSREQVRDRWLALGEDCRVIGPEGVVYVARSELDTFLDHSPPPERRDWVGLYHALLPADFTLRYTWAAGTYPPPHHYEYTITVEPRDPENPWACPGHLNFWPDYPGEGVPRWEKAFAAYLEPCILLFNLMQALNLFSREQERPTEPAPGGETGHLEVTANGQHLRLALHLLPVEERDELHRALRGLVPEHVWQDLEARRQHYIEQAYPEEG